MTVRAASACEKRLLAPLRRQYQCSSVGGNTKLNEKARESSTLSLLPSPCSMRDMNASHRAVGKDSMFFSVHILADSLDFCLFSCHALEKRGHRKCSRGGRGHFRVITKLQVILRNRSRSKMCFAFSPSSLVKIRSKKCSLSGAQQPKGINIAGGCLTKKYMSILNLTYPSLQTKYVLLYLYI